MQSNRILDDMEDRSCPLKSIHDIWEGSASLWASEGDRVKHFVNLSPTYSL
jgi:hypothetical protein